jgi:hypothetical protein
MQWRYRHVVLQFLTIASAASAQVSTTRLGAPTGRAAEGLSEVVAMHELRDGRIMVIDNARANRTVWTVDFRNGALAQFGRRGQGPAEYQEPTSLLPLGDSLLIVDPLAQRVLVVSPANEVVRTGSFPRAVGDPSQRRLRSSPDFIDDRGRFYYHFEVFNPDRSGPRILPLGGIARSGVDRSAEVVLTDWWSRGNEQPLVQNSNVAIWPLRDGWAVRRDGLLAKVLADGYEVVWYREGRESGRTGALPAPDVRVTPADRNALIAEWDKRPMMSLNSRGGGGPTGQKNVIAEYLRAHPEAFPARKSPIGDTEPNVLFDPQGRLWIVRAKAAKDTAYTIDVVQEGRGVVGRVELPAGHRLIGFGPDALYTVRIDDDDLQWVERFAMPPL